MSRAGSSRLSRAVEAYFSEAETAPATTPNTTEEHDELIARLESIENQLRSRALEDEFEARRALVFAEFGVLGTLFGLAFAVVTVLWAIDWPGWLKVLVGASYFFVVLLIDVWLRQLLPFPFWAPLVRVTRDEVWARRRAGGWQRRHGMWRHESWPSRRSKRKHAR